MRILATLSLATGLVAGTEAFAQSIKWDMANEYSDKSIHAEGDRLFAELVDEKTNGDIEITLHFGASLGFRSKDQLDAVADGAVPLADTFTGPISGIHPIFQLSGLPFVTEDFSQARALFEIARPQYEAVLAHNNQTLLWASPWPPAGIWANKAVVDDASLADLKIRTYDQLGTVTLTTAGAAPVQLSWADVVPQLSTGGIDAVLTSAEAGLSVQFPDLLDHYMPIAIGTPLNIATINNDVLNSLTDEQRAAVMEAAAEVMENQWKIVERRVASNFERARSQGVTVIEDLDPAFLEKLRNAGQAGIEVWLARYGDEGTAILEAYNAKIGG
ncbi:TRAP transporter substrate-binding protein [Ruegeria sp. R14_0]|uniref:TRAP transporter substrate-binding protein n=1 Tax=Ruegeria sp. R14_0 TaxID=2821100 RepID=UPI001AD97D2C|nr:TRAP transporter substrate-binding protein [Ruegeria sp. R14_0]MBO9448458.1 TRAP transporter substrate-binding protein [Ruegeria sp. R14_0]